MNLKLKVCGMREGQNIQDVLTLKPDFMGFIFFEKSPRNVGDYDLTAGFNNFPKDTKKVGVFVDAPEEFVVDKVRRYQLDLVQLHGKETVSYCQKLRSLKIPVMKAFSVDENFDFETVESFQKVSDYFLFDTKASGGHGGHGISFDWNLLKKYTLETPFFLAGGIDLSNIDQLQYIENPSFMGIDVNSKFETEPAKKDIEKLKELKLVLDAFKTK